MGSLDAVLTAKRASRLRDRASVPGALRRHSLASDFGPKGSVRTVRYGFIPSENLIERAGQRPNAVYSRAVPRPAFDNTVTITAMKVDVFWEDILPEGDVRERWSTASLQF